MAQRGNDFKTVTKGQFITDKLTDDEKRMRGTFDKRHSEERNLKADAIELGEAPKDFNQSQREAWQIHWDLVRSLKTLSESDVILFREMCILYARMNEANIQLAASATIILDSGAEKPSPWLEIYRSSFDRWLELCREFGIGARSRNKFRPTMSKEEEKQISASQSLTEFLKTKPKP